MKADNFAAQGRPVETLPGPAESPLLWLSLWTLGAAAFFWQGFASLLQAWEKPEYSHGYLIPLVAAYLFLSKLRDIPPETGPQNRGIGVGIVLAGLLVGLLGNLVRIPDIITYGFLICLAGFILLIAGTRHGLKLWAPWLYLGFMLPLPNFVYWPLSIKLQAISSEIGVAFISLMGVPVFLDGNIIDLGVYKLQVAEACNGLRYLFPLMSFGFLFAVLYRGPVWHKAVLFLSSIPLTVFMNSLRIGIIGLLVDQYGIAQAEGFLHAFEGWVIFVVCVAILFGEALLLQRLTTKPNSALNTLDIDTDFLGAQLARVKDIVPTRQLITMSSAVFAAGLAWHLLPDRAVIAPDRKPFFLFPTEIEQWQGTRTTLEPNIEKALAADDYLVAHYDKGSEAAPVNLFIAYYKSQTEGFGIHSPEVCIPSGGWEVSEWRKVATGYELAPGQPLYVNRAIVQKGMERQLVYYWFEQRGRRMTSDYVTKAYAVWDSIAKGRTDGALVRIVTAIGQGEKEEAADKRLNRFLAQTFKLLPGYLPE